MHMRCLEAFAEVIQIEDRHQDLKQFQVSSLVTNKDWCVWEHFCGFSPYAHCVLVSGKMRVLSCILLHQSLAWERFPPVDLERRRNSVQLMAWERFPSRCIWQVSYHRLCNLIVFAIEYDEFLKMRDQIEWLFIVALNLQVKLHSRHFSAPDVGYLRSKAKSQIPSGVDDQLSAPRWTFGQILN